METKEDEWSPDETYAAERAVLIAQITQVRRTTVFKMIFLSFLLAFLTD